MDGNGTGLVTLSGTIVDSNGNRKTKVVKQGSSTYLLTGNNTYTLGTDINGGTLIVGHANALGTSGTITVNSGATLAVNSGITFTRAITLNSGAIFGGTGTYTPGSTFTVGSGVHIAPGINGIGTLAIGNSTTFAASSILDIGFSGTTSDTLNVTGTLDTTVANTLALSGSPTGGFYTLAHATTALTMTGHTAADGGFASATGLDTANYRLNTTSTDIQMIHKADQSLTAASPSTINIITGSTIGISATLSNRVRSAQSCENWVNIARS